MTHKTRKTIPAIVQSISILVATTLVLSFAVTGCNQDDSESVLTPGASTATLGMAPPTLEELQAALNLTTEQRKNVQSALSRWNEAYQEGATQQRRRGFAEGGPHREGDPGQLGRRGRICMTFLEDCAVGLTDEQFGKLIDVIAEKRDQHRASCEVAGEGRRAGRGKGSCDGSGRFGSDLGLTEEQHQAVRTARREARQTMREAGKNYHEGNLTADAMRDLAAETLETLQGSLANTLDDDQFAKVAERSRERATRRAERKLGHLDQATDHRVGSLTRILALDEAQVAAVKAALSELRPRHEALLTGIQTGETSFPDAVYEGLLIREASHEALTAILNEGQQGRLEKLKGFKRGHRGLQLYF